MVIYLYSQNIGQFQCCHAFQTGLFQKKLTNGELRTYFFENLHGIFSFFYFTPGNSRQNNASPLETPQIFVTPLGNLKPKTKTP